MTDGMVKAAVDKLEELALQEVRVQWEVGKKVRGLRDDLDWLRTFLGHADQRRRQQVNEYIELWVRQTREVAFDAEDLLEEYFHRGGLNCRGVLDLPTLLSWLRRFAVGLFVRHSIYDDIDAITNRLNAIKDKRTEHDLHNLPVTWAPPQRHYSEWSTLEMGYDYEDKDNQKVLVRMAKPYEKVVRLLLRSDKQRTVIAIAGESGIGKTTLAKCITKRNFVREKFCVIWVDVPQQFKLMELLSHIIKEATGVMDENIERKSSEAEIKRHLIEKLGGRRYLIVLDNVQNLEEWKFFLAVLPDEGKHGNRVLITTQIKPPCDSSNSNKKDEDKFGGSSLCHHIVEMENLNMSEGKELFCRRVFGRTDFPEGFWGSEKHANNMDKLLDGSPQSITLLAGLLRSKIKDEWPTIVSQLLDFSDERSQHETSSCNMEEHKQQQDKQLAGKQQKDQEAESQHEKEQKQHQDQDQQQGQEKEKGRRQQQTPSMQYKQLPLMNKILMLSFDDLPAHLKQCFLYFAVFNAEVGINCQKLVQLWIAEGFVQDVNGGLTMEECGQEYLKKLVSRCLIKLVEKDYNNNIVTVSIHENILAFARSEAWETNFLQVHNSANNLPTKSIRRLFLQSTFDPNKSLNLSAPKLRSLLCDFREANTDDTSKGAPSRFFNIRGLLKMTSELIMGGNGEKFTIYRCKFLRVIDLKGMTHCDSLPKEFGWLIHLRYLGLAQTSLRCLPSSVRKLHNLQTLDITNANIDEVPRGFWKIQTLRHVLAQNLKSGPDKVNTLCNLQSLLGVPWGLWAENGAALKRLANLRSLHLLNLSSEQDSRSLLDAVCSLESFTSLKLEGSHLPLDGLLTNLFLHRLQYLGLHGPVMAERGVGAESSHRYLLPNLTKLDLNRTEIRQAELNAIANLPNLAELMLDKGSYNEGCMIIPDGGFPELRNLQLKRLDKLKRWEIASGSSGSTLNKLEQISILSCQALMKVPEHLKTLQHLVLLRIHSCPLCKVSEKNNFFLRNKLLIEVSGKQEVDSSIENKAVSSGI